MDQRRNPHFLVAPLALALAATQACGLGIHNDRSTESATGSSTTASTTTGLSHTGHVPSTASTSTAPASGSSTTTGCNFVCEPDWDDPLLECDIFEQDCPEGFKCTVYMGGTGGWDSTQCVPIIGDGQHGDDCHGENSTGEDTCAKGHLCWNLDESGEGRCHAFCVDPRNGPSCEPPNSHCVGGRSGPLVLCMDGCDPLAPECSADEVCIGTPWGDGFMCVLDASDGEAPAGTPCEFANVCNLGLFCGSPTFFPAPDCANALGCCAPFCNLNTPGACEGLLIENAQCVPWFEEGRAPEELAHVGGCGVP